VLSDIIDGFITLESAEQDYGVVIGSEPLRIDHEATARLRAERVGNAVPT